MQTKRILVVIGKVCSGKDTFARQHINHIHIDIGSIVREITQTQERTHDQSLDELIIARLQDLDISSNFIITGIRQLSIIEALLEKYPGETEMIYLDVTDTELKRRFITRAADKDLNTTFEEVIERDAQLGLASIELFIKHHPQLFTIINNN